jgi:hypothetical protein
MVDFAYEIAIDDGNSAGRVDEIVGTEMERMLVLLVGWLLIGCGDVVGRRPRGLTTTTTTTRSGGGGGDDLRRRRRLYVDGVDSTPTEAIVPDAVCKYCTLDNPAPEGTTCHVVRGMMTLYLRKSDQVSLALQSSSGALKVIRDAMNGDVSPGPFSGAAGYVRGSPDKGLDEGGFGGEFGDGSAAGDGGSNATGAAAEVDAAASASSQSPVPDLRRGHRDDRDRRNCHVRRPAGGGGGRGAEEEGGRAW